MVKNVKIDEETHRLMSMKAAKLQVHKNTIASALIELGLSMPDEAILRAIFDVTSHENSRTGYHDQDRGTKSQPADA